MREDYLPVSAVQGTPRQWGMSAKSVIKHNHTRSFRKVLTPSLFVGVWFSSTPDKEKPWHLSYFTRDGSSESSCWSVELLSYATWEELKKVHPFRFADFDADVRYPLEGMSHE